VNPADPNIRILETAAKELGDLRDELIFVGGCAVGLLCTSPSAVPPRVTYDVDVVADISTLVGYHALEKRIAARGFKRDTSADAPVCRWLLANVIVDLMPSEERVLGFANRWYPLAMTTATPLILPSGLQIRLIAAPVFLATKFEAFATRGRGDMLSSHDFEDIINVVEGRAEIEDEIGQSVPELRGYLIERFRAVRTNPDFDSALPGLLAFDALYAERLMMVRQRIETIAALELI
jgi:predicted nucleotidyltransferase